MGELESGLPPVKQTASNKKSLSLFNGFFRALWCALTFQNWNDGTRAGLNGCIQSDFWTGVGNAIAAVSYFVAEIFTGDVGEGGGGPLNNYYIHQGPYPPTANDIGTPVGNTDALPYGDGDIWISKRVADDNPSPGCPIPLPNGDQQPVSTIGDDTSNCNNGAQWHWETIKIDDNHIAATLIDQIGISDFNKQQFVYNHADIAQELYLYLTQNGDTQENKDFLNWAVDYFMANPQVSLEVFKNQFIGATEIIADPNANNWTDNDNEILNDPDQTVYQPYQDTHPWPTIDRVIPFEKFVPMRKDVQGNDVNCLILSKEQLGKAGYTCSGYLPGSQTFQTYTESGGVNLTLTKEAVNYLIDALGKHIPVLVGIDNRPGTPSVKNLDNSTDHFVVIVAMGADSKGKYFQFKDNSTSNISLGASYNNRLYYNSTTGRISGKTMSQYGSNAGFHDYIITQVRKSIKK